MDATDRYMNFSNSSIGKWITGTVGLPQPSPLVRSQGYVGELSGPVIIGSIQGSSSAKKVQQILKSANVDAILINESEENSSRGRVAALVFDATEIMTIDELSNLHDFYHKNIRSMGQCGRALVIGREPSSIADAEAAIVQQGLEGFIRSLGKEMRHGSTAQLIYLEPGAEDGIESTVSFFLSPRSAYVSGQVVRLNATMDQQIDVDIEKPHADRKVLVTGASRGIGAAIAELFARDGAYVIGLDVPQAEGELRALTERLGGSYLTMDITSKEAVSEIVADANERGGYDVVVHNAGITRDKTIANMDDGRWSSVLSVNLSAPLRITNALLREDLIRPQGRIVCLSSVNGIAGSIGQTNYSLSKAGIIGLVQRLAPELQNGITINAVAPGFIETKMTAAIPFAMREVARRMNSMSQGGLPVDVAETISWLAHPGSGGVNGSVVRVCGQSIVGA